MTKSFLSRRLLFFFYCEILPLKASFYCKKLVKNRKLNIPDPDLFQTGFPGLLTLLVGPFHLF